MVTRKIEKLVKVEYVHKTFSRLVFPNFSQVLVSWYSELGIVWLSMLSVRIQVWIVDDQANREKKF